MSVVQLTFSLPSLLGLPLLYSFTEMLINFCFAADILLSKQNFTGWSSIQMSNNWFYDLGA